MKVKNLLFQNCTQEKHDTSPLMRLTVLKCHQTDWLCLTVPIADTGRMLPLLQAEISLWPCMKSMDQA